MAMETIAKVKGYNTPSRAQSDGVDIAPWHGRDGSYVMTPVELAWARAGYVFVGNAGTATSPITFGAGNIDPTEPDFDLLVPAGSASIIVPLQILVHMETFGTSALFEGMASFGLGGAQGTQTSVTPRCLRPDQPAGGSICTVGCAADAGATYMTQNVCEIFRFGTEAVATVGTGDDDSNRLGNTHIWTARQSGIYPHLVASSLAARLNVFASAQAGTGFIQVVWAELPL